MKGTKLIIILYHRKENIARKNEYSIVFYLLLKKGKSGAEGSYKNNKISLDKTGMLM